MAAGMVPPLAMALATTIRPGLFSEPEKENGRAAWLLGASFISEGAIPFAAADPLRVIPSMMVGGAVTGALCQAFDVTLRGTPRRHLRVLRDRQPADGSWSRWSPARSSPPFAVVAAKQFIKPGAKAEAELVAA